MSISITELKREKRELQQNIKDLEQKLEAVDRALQAYSPKNSSGERKNAVGFEFKVEAKRIFEPRKNAPMRMIDLVRKVKENHPELTDRQIKSKIAYAKREASGILENTSYGMYRFKGLNSDESPLPKN